MEKQSGVTMIELVTVMAIIAVLAVFGYLSLTKYIYSVRNEEVEHMFDGMRMAQESFKADHHHYVSNGWVFGAVRPAEQQLWPDAGGATIIGFDTIRFTPDTKHLYHDYRMVACKEVSAAPCVGGPCGWGSAGQFSEEGVPGFILIARGDVNGDGGIGVYCTTSQSGIIAIWAEDWPDQAEH